MELRPYQANALNQLRNVARHGHKGAILRMATGAGKTATAGFVVASAVAKGNTVAWFAHRRELIGQARTTLVAIGLGDAINDGRISFGTMQGGARNIAPPSLVVVDEGHRALSKSYRKILDAWPNAFRLLLTGTVWRGDGQAFAPYATAIVDGPSIAELTAAGWLAPACYWSIPGASLDELERKRGDFTAASNANVFDRPKLVADVVQTYQARASERPALVYASGVEHAKRLCEQFKAAGINAASVDGKTPKKQRRAIFDAMRQGALDVLTSADLLVEGVDFPRVAAIVMARATQSPIIWRQAVGRGLRTFRAKADCMVLDHGGNAMRLGFVCDPLVYEPKSGNRKPQPRAPSVLTCEQCFAVLPSRPRPTECARCGAPIPETKRRVAVAAGELVQLNASPTRKRNAINWQLWRQIDRERRRRGYRPGWTWHQYQIKNGLRKWGTT